MNDKPSENQKKATAPDSGDSPGLLAGQRLAEARRANDVSIAEIAKELHLDEHKVQALEENQFDVLGAPVFAKGHLRKYAELVGMPIDEMLADYYQLNRSAGAPPIVRPRRARLQRNIAFGRWIGGTVVALVMAGLLYWWMSREPSPEPVSTPGVLEPFATERTPGGPDNSSELLPPQDIGIAAGDTVVDLQAAPDQTVDSTTAIVESSVAAAPAEGQLQLVMEFSGDCWTEVTDANGDRLFFGLGQAGLTVSRNGTPPLRALFGDHNNVTVTVDGTDFPIAASGGRANTARVTIDTP